MRHPLLFAMVFVVALMAAACGDSAEPTIEFGEGDVPPAIPSDLPIPGDAVIGTTLIDQANSKSQFEFRTGTPLDELVRGLNVGLVNAGYVVDESTGTADSWRIEFRKNDLAGTYDLVPAGAQATRAVVEVNDA